MASNIILFEDIFVVDKLDPDGKKFDKVTRVEARSHNLEMFMHLDVNTEVYPMAVGDKFTMAVCFFRWPSDATSGRSSSHISFRARPEALSTHEEAVRCHFLIIIQ